MLNISRLLVWALLISAALHAMLVFFIPAKTKVMHNPIRANVTVQVSLAPNPEEFTPLEPQKIPKVINAQAQPFELPQPLNTPATPLGTSGLVLPDKYYEVVELDAIPQPTGQIDPQYPPAALSNGVTGLVNLEMFIDETGEVQSLRVANATVPGVFDQAAIDAFSHRRFEPGLRNGVPVKSHLKLIVNFGENPDANRK